MAAPILKEDEEETLYRQVAFPKKLAVEWTAAACSAFLISPFISIIDKAIFCNASGRQRLGDSIKDGFKTMLFRPHVFVRQPSFLIVYGLYTSTYVVANTIEAVSHYTNTNPFYYKFVGTSLANVSLSAVKDVYFTRAFAKETAAPAAPTTTTTKGAPAAAAASAVIKKKVPFRSYSLYTIRDSLTIFASFNLPGLLASHLNENYSVPLTQARTFAQLFTPCAVQLTSSPLHLLGMDFYNRPQATVGERVSFIKREYVKTTAARIGRIFPAYGIGGVANTFFRKQGRTMLVEQQRSVVESAALVKAAGAAV
ncbi:hypothetical protein HDV05_007016 [Chytridiales sp. JEL 0842]|nr:hypothetical protein HDV05_007016 [Chytridiales sp. JEL 0842]